MAVLEAALARLREGYELAVTPTGDAVTAASASAEAPAEETCYHGCNPRELGQILRHGLLPNVGKRISLGYGVRLTYTQRLAIRRRSQVRKP